MPDQLQNYSNHTRWVPAFHFVAFPILVLNAGWAIYRLFGDASFEVILNLLVAIALLVTLLLTRVFALKAQDRLIRLEMRLRMRELLPVDLQGRVDEFTPEQMVGLRFAGDGELPALSRKVLDDDIGDAKTVKKLVTDWRGDYFRV